MKAHDTVEKSEARAIATEKKVAELEEALKAAEAKTEEVRAEAHREIKSLKARAKAAKQETSKVRARSKANLADLL